MVRALKFKKKKILKPYLKYESKLLRTPLNRCMHHHLEDVYGDTHTRQEFQFQIQSLELHAE